MGCLRGTRRHELLDLVGTARQLFGQHFMAILGHDNVVLGTDADAAPLRRHRLVVRRNVQARLDREHHVRLEQPRLPRSEEHTSELQSLMRISYAVFCLKKKTIQKNIEQTYEQPDT